MTPPGYQIEEKVYESSHSVVYRGWMVAGHPLISSSPHLLISSPQPVILKVLQPAHATPEGLARFRREFEVTQHLTGEGAIQVYSLEAFQNTLAIVVEDFGGDSLARLLNGSPETAVARTLDIPTFLKLAIQMSERLGNIHQQNLIHKDINPANVIWNPASGVVKIIDFGLATSLSREEQEIRNLQVLEGTLAYISPEQTGRMNRAMDYRTDFYSLGATFYHLLTGQPPFSGKEPIELVHAHIARPPVPPSDLNPAVPTPISDMVLRLLAKNAEDRYQSAYGLKADLEECLKQWQNGGRIRPFPLAQKDVSARFQLPQKLYGRDAEIQTLLNAFQRVAGHGQGGPGNQGNVELLLVTGGGGIGKSSLVREIHKPITMRRGYFMAGKFDQLHRTPYASLIQACQELIGQILTESEAQITAWREKLLAALGSNAQVMIEVIPVVQLITGPQPTPPALPPAEAENRFTLAFRNFLRVFAQADHPLVLFLDDWQWMDAGSRQLLQRLITAPHTRHLLVIGAYRDAEVGETHPVWQMVNAIREAGIRVNSVALPPLTLPGVNQFIADTVSATPGDTHLLAELILEKTGGNPFFMGEFLKSLYTAGLIAFDYEQGRWGWDLARIQAEEITDNVVELMMGKIQKLAPATQTVLQLAACIGAQFDLETLALAYEQPAQQTAVTLWEAIVAGLVTPLNDEYKLAVFDVPAQASYKFAHDRIQQAAYALIGEAEKQAIHRRIGQYLLQATAPEQRDGRIFTILNHLNLAQTQLTSQTERYELAVLNLEAGQKALSSAAFLPALDYLQTGIGLLAGDAWERQYDLALALHTQAAVAAYLSGRYEAMERWAGEALEHGRNLLDQLPVYETKIQSYTQQNRLNEAVETAVPVLKQLGVNLPPHPSRRHLLTAILKTRLALRGKTPDDLLNLPIMTDPQQLAITSLLSRVGVTAYFLSPELFALTVLELTQIYVKHGNTPYACRVYAAYGMILAGALGEIDRGYEFCQLGIAMVEKLQAAGVEGATLMIFNNFVRHWKEPMRATLPGLQAGYQAALAAGDPEFATFCAYGYSKHALYVGVDLAQLVPEMVQYGEVMAYFKKEKIHYVHNFYLQTAVNLSNPVPEPQRLKGEYYDEDVTVPQYRAANDRSALCAYNIQKAILYYLFGQPTAALPYIAEAETTLRSILGSNSIPLFYLYDSLIRLALYPTAPTVEQKKTLKKVAANQKMLAKFGRHTAANFAHKQALVAAETARVQGEWAQAAEWYDQAIELAAANQFTNEEALALELAGVYYQGRGNGHRNDGRLAQHYLQQANDAYLAWGATRKAEEMADRFPFLAQPETARQPLSSGLASTTAVGTTAVGTTAIASTAISATATLDLTSVIKASQALSGEIVLGRLQERLMAVVIENAGAQTGYLLLAENGRWNIAAYGGEGASGEMLLPSSLINYVARVQTAVLLDDATQSQFSQDTAVQQRQVQSALCMPLLNQGNLAGILYLENNQTPGAFTENHLAVLNMLASQAAISIENAQLVGRLEEYNRTLEEKVEERTAELAQATQEAEVARTAAEKASAAKSAFLANMSHELRTPLNAIIGFTRIVRRRSSDTLPDKQASNLDRVLISAEHLLNLINTILDIAKIEAGRMDVQAANFNLTTVIDLCITTVQPLVKRGVTIEKELDPDLPILYSDQDKVRQILINLLGNAAKFTANGRITIHASQQGDKIAIAVSDTGIGIAPTALARIFEEFQQAETTTRQEYGGSGLGLSISRSLAQLLGGGLTAVSTPGLGSTFTLTIPVYFRNP